MKTAYLIAAHTDPRQLRRLVLAVEGGGKNDTFIHIDKKADIQTFREAMADIPVFFTKERVRTLWGAWSQCCYQQVLMRECLQSGRKYDRVFFLSGLDYPLWSNGRIERFLEEHRQVEFIGGMNLSRCHESAKMQTRVRLYHFRDLPFRSAWLRRTAYGVTREVLRGLGVTKKNYIEDRGKRQDVYCGSSWWCLTGECLQYVYDTMQGNPCFKHYLRTCLAPDELLVQTIVFNSPYASRAMLHRGGYPGLAGLTPLHYIEYTDRIAVFDEHDFGKLVASGKMFCRKVQTGVSDKLLDLIDEYRLEEKEGGNPPTRDTALPHGVL